MKTNNLKGSIILITAAFIWGMAFVAQSSAANKIPSFTINFLRSYIGAAFLFLYITFRDIKKKIPLFPKEKKDRKKLFIGGLVCGIALWIASNLQQFGIGVYPDGVASEARAGFLTALYVILVPIASVFFKKKIHPIVWIAVIMALIGVYLLCMSGGISGIYTGDILLLTCAIGFTVHIVTIDTLGKGLDGVKLSILQFFVCGTISIFFMLFLEYDKVSFNNILNAAIPVLYLGIMSSGIAYTLQIIGQKYANPAIASIAMSLESVFAALGGWLVAGNGLMKREIIGCAVMFSAIIIAQLSDITFKKKEKVQ